MRTSFQISRIWRKNLSAVRNVISLFTYSRHSHTVFIYINVVVVHHAPQHKTGQQQHIYHSISTSGSTPSTVVRAVTRLLLLHVSRPVSRVLRPTSARIRVQAGDVVKRVESKRVGPVVGIRLRWLHARHAHAASLLLLLLLLLRLEAAAVHRRRGGVGGPGAHHGAHGARAHGRGRGVHGGDAAGLGGLQRLQAEKVHVGALRRRRRRSSGSVTNKTMTQQYDES